MTLSATRSARRLALVLSCATLPFINGCTVLGMVADHALFEEERRNQPLMEQNTINEQEVLFGQLGLEADIAIAKKVISTVKGTPEQPATRCKMENGIRFCYEEGAEGY
ncbi:hypothetical protein [Rheinheimera nanhaiensis]|uniref:hypothetical protein n=1 Tax=Rheinheimera nanhaiensis TaxID=1163621 RepID=UPI00058FE6F4|nr:hypothetical protein [Rheinheimera nanhaiensis]